MSEAKKRAEEWLKATIDRETGDVMTAFNLNNSAYFIINDLLEELKMHETCAKFAKDRITALEAELSEWKKAVEGLTPSGSEFVNDPKACADHIRERTRYPKMIVDLRRKVVALEAEQDALKEVLEDKQRLVRDLDRIWNGEEGMAKQASLCDIVAQIQRERDQARMQAAMKCLEIIGNGGWYNEGLENSIRQHFGMEGGE